MGTDLAYGGDMIGVELKHMVDFGMSPKKAIEVSTRGGAELLGMEDRIGTLEPGKEADLLVVDGDPLQDISLLSRLEALLLVMQGGKPVAGPMKSQFPVERPELPWYQTA
jgi:imidazolonepropionase-like amidohydrolase